jgi:putative protease
MEALKAAIANGADAVYLGAKDFNARTGAENFDTAQLVEAIRLCAFHDVKIYLTANTLLTDKELPVVLQQLRRLYNIGLDAVIVQDMGLLALIREALPGLAVHASTQTTTHNGYGVAFLAECGVERVIMPRELSLATLSAINEKSPIELEAFVHGAMCICYSGQCLMSSMIGGRSGNRGRCAQPCRMVYKLVDEIGDEIAKVEGKYLLSPKDLYGYTHIEELHDVGLAAWKIEGRMKKPEYVATVTRIYHKYLELLDARRVIYKEDEDLRQLLQSFNRDYGNGYLLGNPGSDLMNYQRPNNRGVFLGRITAANENSIRIELEQPLAAGDGLEIWVKVGGREGFTVEQLSVAGEQRESAAAGEEADINYKGTGRLIGNRVFKTFDSALNQEAKDSYKTLPTKALQFQVKAKEGEKLEILGEDSDGYQAHIICDYIVSPALTSNSDWISLKTQLGRLGGSGFHFESVEGELDDNVMIPISVLNHARRYIVDQIMAERLLAGQQEIDEAAFTKALKTVTGKKGKKAPTHALPTAMVDDPAMAVAIARAGIKEIYLAAENFQHTPEADLTDLIPKLRSFGSQLIMAMPRIMAEEETEYWRKAIKKWQKAGIETILIENTGQLALLKEMAWQGNIYGGSGLNTFNSRALRLWAEKGLSRMTLSPEMTLAQLQNLPNSLCQKEFIVQGALPLIISEYCALGVLLGERDQHKPCTKPCRIKNNYELMDEKGYSFPCRMDQYCRMHIFNSRELCLMEDIPELEKAGIDFLRLDLRLYAPEKAIRLAQLYAMATEDKLGLNEALTKIKSQVKDYTRGHLYRGV